MSDIWIESDKSYTCQRLSDLARLILKKDSMSDPEIIEICGKINQEEIHKDSSLNELKHKILKTKSSLNLETHQY